MKMASRLIDLIRKKNKLHVLHTFSSNYRKTNLHVQHAILSFPCRWRNCRMCLPNILFPVFMFIHISVSIKNNVEKDTTLLLFFLSKSPGSPVISVQIKP